MGVIFGVAIIANSSMAATVDHENDVPTVCEAGCINAASNESPATQTAIHYTIVKAKKTSPYRMDLSYPKFKGAPQSIVVKLNGWVKDNIGLCDAASNVTRSHVESTMNVTKLNEQVIVISGAYAGYCSSAAHSNKGSYTSFLSTKTGEEVDLWELLPDSGRSAILSRIAKAGQGVSADDECKVIYSSFSENAISARFSYKSGQMISLFPTFSYAAQSCDDRVDATIQLDELKKLYPPQSPALTILEGLRK